MNRYTLQLFANESVLTQGTADNELKQPTDPKAQMKPDGTQESNGEKTERDKDGCRKVLHPVRSSCERPGRSLLRKMRSQAGTVNITVV